MTQLARLGFQCQTCTSPGERLNWERDGRDWPNREASRFVRAGGLTWHVQRMGEGPVIFMAHGTGASTHSWRALAPLLARHFTVVAPDLPGHGFTEMPRTELLSLPGMAGALGALLDALEIRPALAVGHSAGAAILARMCLDGRIAPRALFSLNGAFLPFGGAAAHVFSPVARLMAALPPVPWLFARLAGNPGAVERLIDGTGSRLEPDGVALYRRLVRNPGHVAAALGMMANWRLEPLERDLPRLATPLALIVGADDRTIPPADAVRIRALLPAAKLISLPGLGHLAHEEAPAKIAELIARCGNLQTNRSRP
jgi:magnesium chelatase accessory protein